MQVMKFGGTSVRNAEALMAVSEIVGQQTNQECGTIVVLSATAGTTNTLLSLGRLAASGHAYDGEYTEFEQRHLNIAIELGVPLATAEGILRECRQHLDAAATLGECTPQTLDAIAGFGELLSTSLFADYLADQGVKAAWVDARDVVVTDDEFGSAAVDLEKTTDASQRIIKPLLDSGAIVVTQGFIGATEGRIPTTLGRGGSDYTAALLGRCLGAAEIQIWTDVSGVYSCDPRIVSEAQPLAAISFDDVRTLALYGAKVLHPETVQPAVDAGIPVRVLNTFEPSAAGTIITAEQTAQHAITALAMLQPCLRIHTSGPVAQALAISAQLAEKKALHVATKSGHMIVVHTQSEQTIMEINVALAGCECTIESVACIALCGAQIASAATLAQIADKLSHISASTITSALHPSCVIVTVPIEHATHACLSLHQLISSSASAS